MCRELICGGPIRGAYRRRNTVPFFAQLFWGLHEIAKFNMSLATCSGFLFQSMQEKLQGKLHRVTLVKSNATENNFMRC